MATYLPFSDVVAAYGYRQPPPAKQRMNLLMLALAYTVMGGALGTVAGAGAAMATFHTGVPTLVFQVASPVQASSTVDSAVTPQPQTSALPSQVVTAHASTAKPSPVKLAKASFAVFHPHRSAHPASPALKQVALTTVSEPIATPSPVAAATPVLPAVAETETKSYLFLSEGDVTVADFDASMGRIETYEGRTFELGTTAAASAPASLQDSGSSVHYRCDQSGSCTLYRAGLVLQNVRMM
jgi:hypothetical protein